MIVVLTLRLDDGSTAELAARAEDRGEMVGPYMVALATSDAPGAGAADAADRPTGP